MNFDFFAGRDIKYSVLALHCYYHLWGEHGAGINRVRSGDWHYSFPYQIKQGGKYPDLKKCTRKLSWFYGFLSGTGILTCQLSFLFITKKIQTLTPHFSPFDRCCLLACLRSISRAFFLLW